MHCFFRYIDLFKIILKRLFSIIVINIIFFIKKGKIQYNEILRNITMNCEIEVMQFQVI